MLLRVGPPIVLALLGAPIVAGLLGALAPAFGYLPALGADAVSLAPWRDLFATPGIWSSIALSFWVGIASTAISLAATFAFLAAFSGTRTFAAVLRALSPLLSAPHAAAALGFAFLLAPSGFLARLASPWATGWERPPDLLTTHDPYGLAMILALVAKEIPFLLLMSIAALPQLRAADRVAVARSMGYRPATAWMKTVAPGLYPLIRLPVFAVIAYAASTVEVAMILGPTTPPPLAVRVLAWMNDPDLTMRLTASAGAIAQLLVVVAALALWRVGEIVADRLCARLAADGARRTLDGVWTKSLAAVAPATALLLGLGLLGLLIASFGGRWRFPDALPQTATLEHWMRAGPSLGERLWTTLALAFAATGAALAAALLLLEADARRRGAPDRRAEVLLFAPLIVPQISFLFGLSIGVEALGVRPGFWSVAAVHALFVTPYVYLSLAEAYRRFDPRWISAARTLGRSEASAFWTVRAPMLLAPLLTAAAVGVAVSIGQFLPTRLIGAGRIETVTTEAVALASGGDRRLIGVMAAAQAFLPTLGFALALLAPRLVFRNRRRMLEAPA